MFLQPLQVFNTIILFIMIFMVNYLHIFQKYHTFYI